MRTFADIAGRAENPVAAAMVLLLAWMVSTDGYVQTVEREALRAIAVDGRCESEFDVLLRAGQAGDAGDLQSACEILQRVPSWNGRLLLKLAIGVALKDGYLTLAEGHILRLITDVIGQAHKDLDEMFRELTGEPFPPPSDPGTVEWWRQRERRSQQSRSGTESRESRTAEVRQGGESASSQRLQDLSALGLDEDASSSQIRNAYRRLAHLHHPDEFNHIGADAVKSAEDKFRRIRDAYMRLAKP